MLKVGDEVVSLVDLETSDGITVNMGTVGIVKEKGEFNSLVIWERGVKNCYGKIEWWIDDENLKGVRCILWWQ